jgi:hypothetical protein
VKGNSPQWRLAAAALVGIVAASVGCESRSNLAPLSGSVTYNGEPLEFGSVTLQPSSGGSISRAQIQPDGTFTMTTDGREGAIIGTNRVRVTCFSSQKPGSSANAGGGEASLGDSLIPEKYSRFSSSGLSVDVKPDGNPEFTIELTD